MSNRLLTPSLARGREDVIDNPSQHQRGDIGACRFGRKMCGLYRPTSHSETQFGPTENDAKILDLFGRRGVASYAQVCLAQPEAEEWLSVAMEIQRRIYSLDTHYETTAVLGSETESRLWERLEGASSLVTHETLGALQAAISDLREYGRDESRVHQGELFDTSEWPAVLQRKSADVNLARELVYGLMGSSAPSQRVRQFLRAYDQLMELVEDLEDVHEDTRDWNLNFWLTPIRQGVPWEQAVTSASRVLGMLASSAESSWHVLGGDEQALHSHFWFNSLRSVGSLIEREGEIAGVLKALQFTPYEILMKDSEAQHQTSQLCPDGSICGGADDTRVVSELTSPGLAYRSQTVHQSNAPLQPSREG